MKHSIARFHKLQPALWRSVIILSVLIAATGCSTTNIYLPGENQTAAVERIPQPPPARPIPWRDVIENPATVEVLSMTPVPLAASTNTPGWIRVPEVFQRDRMIVHMPSATVNGVSDFQVKKAGYVFLACNYDYQGNASGGWQETRWTKDKFIADGWREVTEPELRGVLVNADNRQQIIFLKKLAPGESGRLRCNKYDPHSSSSQLPELSPLKVQSRLTAKVDLRRTAEFNRGLRRLQLGRLIVLHSSVCVSSLPCRRYPSRSPGP